MELSEFWVGEEGRIYDAHGDKVWGVTEIGFLRGKLWKLDKGNIGTNWYPFP